MKNNQEDKYKHQCLKYKKVIVNFVFSFSWDVVKNSFIEIEDKILKDNWTLCPLYSRPLNWHNNNSNYSYHPTIVAKNLKVLQKSEKLNDKITIVAPYKRKDSNSKSNYKEIRNLSLNYDIRIFENGTGVCTFSIISNEEIPFEQVLLIQHLATSISYPDKQIENHTNNRNTHALLEVNNELKDRFEIEKNVNRIYLADLFAKVLNSYKELDKFIWDSSTKGEDLIKIDVDKKNDWQNPYVITIIKTTPNDLKRIFTAEDEVRRNITKEIGAIAVRLTEDNGDDAETYFNRLRREYIFKALGSYQSPVNNEKSFEVKLKNYSHNNNLFYTYGRRAAIVITDDFKSHPAYYAIPTLINILELLRSRWHLGTLTNLILDETFERIAHTENVNKLIDEIFKCRVLYGLFLQNPTPYLFDSGAVTEISDTAESVFWLAKIKDELESKLKALDRLIEDIYAKQRIREYGV